MLEVRREVSLDNNRQREFLAARGYLLRIFQSIFGAEPSRAVVGLWDGRLAQTAFSVHGEGGREALAPSCESLCDSLHALKSATEDEIEVLRGAHTRLFVGPGLPAALPWESMYRSVNRTLFSEVTLDVRRTFKRAGVAPEAGPGVSDDHIALELEFLCLLNVRMISLMDDAGSGEPSKSDAEEGFSRECAMSQAFLSDHLLRWVEDFSQQCKVAAAELGVAGMGFYLAAAAALVDFLAMDYTQLRLLPSA